MRKPSRKYRSSWQFTATNTLHCNIRSGIGREQALVVRSYQIANQPALERVCSTGSLGICRPNLIERRPGSGRSSTAHPGSRPIRLLILGPSEFPTRVCVCCSAAVSAKARPSAGRPLCSWCSDGQAQLVLGRHRRGPAHGQCPQSMPAGGLSRARIESFYRPFLRGGDL
jgi:hypothetical protein